MGLNRNPVIVSETSRNNAFIKYALIYNCNAPFLLRNSIRSRIVYLFKCSPHHIANINPNISVNHKSLPSNLSSITLIVDIPARRKIKEYNI